MHPGYKLQHFRTVGWPEDWIQVAETMICDEWETYYKPKAHPVGPNVENISTSSSHGPGLGRRSAQASASVSLWPSMCRVTLTPRRASEDAEDVQRREAHDLPRRR